MRADEVVGVLPVVDQRVQLLDAAGQIGAGVEFVAPRAVASFDAAVELRHAWRQHVELDVFGFAGGFELGHEFGAAVDLDGFKREGQIGLELVEEQRRGRGRGAIVCLAHGPFGDRAVAGEMSDGLAGHEPDVDGIDLHDLTGFFRL